MCASVKRDVSAGPLWRRETRETPSLVNAGIFKGWADDWQRVPFALVLPFGGGLRRKSMRRFIGLTLRACAGALEFTLFTVSIAFMVGCPHLRAAFSRENAMGTPER